MEEVFATVVTMAVLSLGLMIMALLTMAPDVSSERRCPPGQEDINNVCVPK
jgi:hypothetical protein